MSNFDFVGEALEQVRATCPLVHCITNYVTVNDCANALLGIGGSPIMSDEPDDAAQITRICGGLDLNIGTLNSRSIAGMHAAGKVAGELGHKILLDPVGAGASDLRTGTASDLLDELPVTVLRGNMSEVKAVAGAAAATRGVDANPDDAVTDENLADSAAFVRSLAAKAGCVVAVTGAIDLIAACSPPSRRRSSSRTRTRSRPRWPPCPPWASPARSPLRAWASSTATAASAPIFSMRSTT